MVAIERGQEKVAKTTILKERIAQKYIMNNRPYKQLKKEKKIF